MKPFIESASITRPQLARPPYARPHVGCSTRLTNTSAKVIVASINARAKIAVVGALLLVGSSAVTAQVPREQVVSELAVLTDKVFASWNSTRTPGCAVGVGQGGETWLTRAYGMADLNAGIAIQPSTVLESGSVAKQFTATAVLLLMQEGKLSLDDDARKYLPELPVYSRPITVRNLLTHTSGLREWSNLMEWQGWPRGTRLHTQSDVFDVITRQRALNYPVGDYYSYTNSGFLLLRTLVERVSGMSFPAFTAQRIFGPLGMTHTQWRDDFTRVVPGLAQAYVRRGDRWALDMPFDNVIAAGGLLTTVSDWLLWNSALTNRKLGRAWSDSITRQMTLTNGTKIQYALGISVTQYRGLREVSHSGSTAGYSTFLARYPDRNDLSIAVMCNASGAPATAYAHSIVDGMVQGLTSAAAPDTVAVSPAFRAGVAGVYRDLRTNTAVVFDTSGGGIRRGGAVLRAVGADVLLIGATRIRLHRSAAGTVTGYAQATADGDSLEFRRVADHTWTPGARELEEFAGKYRSDEISATFDVQVAGDRLSISPRVGVVDTIVPLYQEGTGAGRRDTFSNGGDAVWFTRDAKGRVTAMHFGSARVWDFESRRVH